MWAQKLVAPANFKLVEVAEPREDKLREGEVLLKVLAAGICGSDLPHFAGKISGSLVSDSHRNASSVAGYPIHEVVGDVIASRFTGISPNDRVVGWASGTNALAEFVVADGAGVNVYSDKSLKPNQAIMIQPLACVLFTLAQIGDVAGKRVAVLGQGPIGVLFSHAAKSAGASHVIGVDRVLHQSAERDFGVDEFVHSSTDRWAATLTDCEKPEIVIEAIGHQVGTLTDAIESLAFGGTVYYFGVPDDPVYPVSIHAMLRKNATLRSGYVTPPFRRRAIEVAALYLHEHPELVAAYVTHVFDHTDAEKAFRRASSPTSEQHKVVIAMDSS